jgi:hypothetical protein
MKFHKLNFILVYEKYLTSLIIDKMGYHLTPVKILIIRKPIKYLLTNVGKDERKETLVHHCIYENCQSLYVQRFFWEYISRGNQYVRENFIPLFIAASFTIVKIQKPANCPRMNE